MSRDQPKLCERCGSTVEEGDEFCGVCGAQFSFFASRDLLHDSTPSPPTSIPSPPTKSIGLLSGLRRVGMPGLIAGAIVATIVLTTIYALIAR